MTLAISKIFRRVSVSWSAWLDARKRRIAAASYKAWMNHQSRECFRAAERIYLIGFDNIEAAQVHLSRAKDELYSASAAFKTEAGRASNRALSKPGSDKS